MFRERSDDMVATMQKPSSERSENDEVVADENSSSSSLVEVSPQHPSRPPQETRMDEIASLLQFASTGKVEDVRKILDEGLDVNQPDYDGRTALHLAASEGHYGVVELLLERKADVNPVDRWRDTPLIDAMRYVKGGQEKREEYKRVCGLLAAHGGKGANQEENTQAEQSQEEWEQLQEEYDISPDEINFEKAELIGEGSFGEVYLVNWRGTKVAAKTVLHKLEQREEIKREFRMELLLLQSLRHPNIVEFLGAITKGDRPVIVTEYLTNGDLHEIIQRRGRIPAQLAVRYALDIARGMNYLHQHKPKAIVHRDLKPRNLLQDEAGNLKVADFGLSKLLEPIPPRTVDERYQMTGGTGTYRYMAPEVYEHKKYDKSVDVFSFGIIVNEMFEGRPSQQTDPGDEVAHARARSDRRPQFFAKTYPPHMKDLLKRCWDGDPAKRPTFEDIIIDLEAMLSDLKPTSRWKPKPMLTEVKEKIQRWRRPSSNNLGGESKNGGGGKSHRGSTRPTDGSVSGSVSGSVHTPKQQQQQELRAGATAQQHDEGIASTSSPGD